MVTRFAGSNDAIVTAETCANYFVMIQRRDDINPLCRRHAMASLAVVRCVRMIARFTRCDGSVVATKASADHFVVVQR